MGRGFCVWISPRSLGILTLGFFLLRPVNMAPRREPDSPLGSSNWVLRSRGPPWLETAKPAAGNISFPSVCPGPKPVFPCRVPSTTVETALAALRRLPPLAALDTVHHSLFRNTQASSTHSPGLLSSGSLPARPSPVGLSRGSVLVLTSSPSSRGRKWQPSGLIRPTSRFLFGPQCVLSLI